MKDDLIKATQTSIDMFEKSLRANMETAEAIRSSMAAQMDENYKRFWDTQLKLTEQNMEMAKSGLETFKKQLNDLTSKK